MDFIQHTIAWCRGEIFEGKILFFSGMALVLAAIVFHLFGTTPNAKAMLWPILVVGIMLTGTGVRLVLVNQARVVEYREQFEAKPTEFLKAELTRSEKFISWYPTTRYILAGIGLVGLLMFLLWGSPMGRAISIALLMITLSSFFIDHFSEERAHTYHQHLEAAQRAYGY